MHYIIGVETKKGNDDMTTSLGRYDAAGLSERAVYIGGVDDHEKCEGAEARLRGLNAFSNPYHHLDDVEHRGWSSGWHAANNL